LQIGPHQVVIERKRTKHLYLKIKNATQVHVSAPRQWPHEDIVAIIESRSDWITEQQQKFAERPELATAPLVDGAMIPYRGRQYRLALRQGASKVTIVDDEIIVQLAQPEDESAVIQRLERWYRSQLKQQISELLSHWQPIMQVQASDFGVRKMKTRWGSCNIRTKKIWLNFDLIKKSPQSLEYVVVHELTHLYERYHNARFYALMDKFLPDWSVRRHRLNHNE
jgi:predicted metal-dependent hydrolase